MTPTIARVLVVTAVITGFATPPNKGVEPVYRYINILDGTVVRLGEPFTRTDLAERVNETTYSLRPGTFEGGGTTSIVAITDASGVLRSLTFEYDGSESLTTKVANYTDRLGPPTEATERSDRSLYVWQDSHTRFELHFTPGRRPAFWSRLIDRMRARGVRANPAPGAAT